MDLKDQIARRRAELAEEDLEVERAQAHIDARRLEQDKAQREHAIDQIAADVTAEGMPVRRVGQELSLFAPPPLPDLATMKRAKLVALANREIRRRWTTQDNWVVIGCISAGIALLHLAGAGALLIIIGLARRGTTNKRCREQLFAEHPQLREALEHR